MLARKLGSLALRACDLQSQFSYMHALKMPRQRYYFCFSTAQQQKQQQQQNQQQQQQQQQDQQLLQQPSSSVGSRLSEEHANLINMLSADARTAQVYRDEQQQTEVRARLRNPEKSMARKVLRDIVYSKGMTVAALRNALAVLDTELFQQSLTALGFTNIRDEQTIEFQEAEILCYEYECKLVQQEEISEQETWPVRPPVITIMGHVDHGKTTLLDSLRKSHVVDSEFGGITQKIGAFHNITSDGQRITYIDTPGHEAFINMRVRGASCTDFIVLVVSALDGIQKQTLEVIEIAQSWRVPLIVAVNKIDAVGADAELVERELYERARVDLESFGGNVPVIHISAKKGTNIDLLEELILFEVELLQLRAKRDCPAEGIVLESRKHSDGDSQRTATIIVQKGTLKLGDFIVIGDSYCKVKQLNDDRQPVEEAKPSEAVEIIGVGKDQPRSGDAFFAVQNEAKAQLICKRRAFQREQKMNRSQQLVHGQVSRLNFKNAKERRLFHSGNKDFIKQKYLEVEQKLLKQKEDAANDPEQLKIAEENLANHYLYLDRMVTQINHAKNINLIVKVIDFGTKETLIGQIQQVLARYPEAKFNLIAAEVGTVTLADIKLAIDFNAKILSMDVPLQPEAAELATQEKIQITSHRLIYSVIDEIKSMLDTTEEARTIQVQIGMGMVKSVFKVKGSKGGKFTRNCRYKLLRANKIIKDELEVTNLKHFKDEVQHINKGDECGIAFLEFDSFQPGDFLEAYENKQE